MKSNTWRYLFSALCYVAAVAASNLHKRLTKPTINSEPQVLSLNFQRHSVPSEHPNLERRSINEKSLQSPSSLDERAAYVQQVVDNDQNSGLLYLVNVTVGKPPQPVRLRIGTASSDIWVDSVHSTYCLENDDPCNQSSFDPEASSSYTLLRHNEFNITYLDESRAGGDYFADALSIGGSTVLAQQMGLANRTTLSYGVLGIGYEGDEAIALINPNDTYPNLVSRLMQQNLTKSRAYSIWLGDLHSPEGSLLFGGVDAAKYTGTLKGTPIQIPSNSTVPTAFTVEMESMYYDYPDGTHIIISEPFNISLSVESKNTIVPTQTFDVIASIIGTKFHDTGNPNTSYYTVDCDLNPDVLGTLSFSLGGPGGPTIGVSFADFISPSNTPGTCYLTIAPTAFSNVILGDSFLRLVYVVYDLDGQEIFMAPTVFNATTSNIYEIEGPQKHGVIDISSSPSVTSSSSRSSSLSMMSTSTPSKTTSPTAGHAKKKNITVPVVASVVPVVAIAGLIGLYFLLRRRSLARTGPFAPQPPPAPSMAELPSKDARPVSELPSKDARPISELPSEITRPISELPSEGMGTWGSDHTAANSPMSPTFSQGAQLGPGFGHPAPPHSGSHAYELDGSPS